ncbi:P1 family peptidase [Inquilinus limosus]|uniref:Peptidase S58 DmpA n=1 Tax=Inquilinus limosus MP06 TaxID=1398085 RepID=A0A0A0D9P7_9PROT|nr:P1 family peptidase [Inquilinus limosus]KGM34829.1 peptidase S58 DmpA [Inquilinus limosus MP06]
MRNRRNSRGPIGGALATGLLATLLAAQPAMAEDAPAPVLNAGEKVLRFDWPAVQVGTGEYKEGPTGVTVFHFDRRSLAAVDVRGGGPGTVNTDYLRLGYDAPELDAVVFSGGSWYGLEATTAVASALKEDGVRGGHWDNIALSVGAIIYDLGGRRLNEIVPDKRLAQAAFRAAKPGVFPLGAQGAGRLAVTGSLFGCNAYSGQGGAFRQIGPVKVAAFVVVNALGVVTRRDGKVAACYGDEGWPKDLTAAALLAGYPASRKPGWTGAPDPDAPARNTTVSLIVTNQKLKPAELQRLAIQVHSSMGRALQPFATEFDGDVLYAVSTGELEDEAAMLPTVDLGVIGGEAMWDAILASVPDQPKPATPAGKPVLSADQAKVLTGDYVFSPFVTVRVTAEGDTLFAQATGARAAFAIGKEQRTELTPVSATDFMVPGRYPLTLRFEDSGRLVLNPGHWEQTGTRQGD